MKRHIFCFFLFGSFSGMHAQIPASHTDLLREDFTIFRSNINSDYPSFYRYTDKNKMTAMLDSCYKSINPNTTNLNFYSMLKFILSSVKDGHLYCGMPPDVASYMNTQAKFFPLGVRFISDRAFVLNSKDSIPEPGSEIISINGTPIKVLKTDLCKYIVSDGATLTRKMDILNHYFYFYYYLVFGNVRRFNVNVRLKDGRIKTVQTDALPEKAFVDNSRKAATKDLLRFSIRPDNIAVVTIKTFDKARLDAAQEYFVQFLKSTFKKIRERNIHKLIIDLRGNGGGRDLYGSLLYSYLTDQPFRYYRSLISATKHLPFEQFQKKNSSFNNLEANMLSKCGESRFRMAKTAHSNLQVISPNNLNYKGKVWFLIDNGSFSTTAEFCAVAKNSGRGLFIGEETGGAYAGNTSGTIKTITLPNSKINISYGLVKYEMDVKPLQYSDRGIIPDYKVLPTIDDIFSHIDTQMNFALKLAAF